MRVTLALLVAMVAGTACGGSSPAADGGVGDSAGEDADGPPPVVNAVPVPADDEHDVELGAFLTRRMIATDADGDPITYAVASAPPGGALTNVDPATGVFTYRSTLASPGDDSFTFQASDGKDPPVGTGTVTLHVKASTLFREWIATDVVKNGASCANTAFTLDRTMTTVAATDRAYVCGSTTTTLSNTSYNLVNDKLYLPSGPEVGTLSPDAIIVNATQSVSGCGTVTYWFRIMPTAAGLALEEGYSSGSCGSTSVTALLKKGAQLGLVSSGDFGRVKYLDPLERTIVAANDGDMTATAVAPSAAMTNPFAFKGGAYPGIGGTCGATLASGATCTVVLGMTPSATGTFASMLSLGYSNGARTKAATLPLAIEVWRPAALDVAPAPASFGLHDLGSLPATLSLAVTNAGTEPATAIAASLAAGPFAFTGGSYPGTGGSCGASLPAGASCTLAVDFLTTPRGRYASELTLAFFDGGQATTRKLPVTGTAANFVGYGLRAQSYYGNSDLLPFFDLGPGTVIAPNLTGSMKEVAYNPTADTFFATSGGSLISKITRLGAVSTITAPGGAKGAAVDTLRNRLAVVNSSGASFLDLTTNVWSYLAGSSFSMNNTLAYNPADDTFVGLRTSSLDDLSGTLQVFSPTTLAVTRSVPLVFPAGFSFFDVYGDHTELLSTGGKAFLKAQVQWWTTGQAAAAGVYDTMKTVGYELDTTTGALTRMWETPEDAVQPASTVGLYGVGEYRGCNVGPCTVDVTVNTGIPTVLLLTAYEATNWRLTVTGGTTLQKVIVRGAFASTVANAGSAVVDNQSGVSTILWAYKANAQGAALQYKIENQTGLPMRRFLFGDQAAAFTIDP